jgi:hypothetical protein
MRFCFKLLRGVIAALCISVLLMTTSLFAQDRSIQPLRITEELELDGILNESFWQDGSSANGFTQQRPDDGQPATERTEVRVVYNDQMLYIGLWAFDSKPSQIIATQMRRDGDLSDDDYFQVILDTFLDRQNGLLFATNPDGARFDAQVRNEGRSEGRFNTNMITEWDGVWDVVTTRTDEGWFAEIAIPWRTLRFEAGENMTFGVNFERQIRRRNEQSFWAPVIKPFTITQVSVAGTMIGLNLVERVKRNLQVKPYSLGGATWTYNPLIPTDRSDDFDGGVDIKYGVTHNLSMDLTYNTDFSQVEVDEAQVNLTQFSLFFPEKRGFFLENSGLFSFGVARNTELFYSRNIGLARDSTGTLREVPILAGGRMTGKVGRSNVGLLLMRTGDKQFGSQVIDDNNYAVARLSQDVGEKSNVGLIFTNSQTSGNNYNRAGGADFNVAVGPKLAVSGFLAGTTFNTGTSSKSGVAGRLWSRWNGPLWQFEGFYMGVSENFDPGMGFFSRQSLAQTYGGFHEISGRIFFAPEPENSFIRRFFPHVVVAAVFGDDGTQLTRQEHYHYEMFLTGGEIIGITLDRSFQRISTSSRPILGVKLPTGGYTAAASRMHFTTNLSKPVFGTFTFVVGQFFNGDRRTLQLTGGLRYGSNFTIEPRYELNDVDLTDNTGIKQDVTAHILGARTTYSFSPNVSARALVQWDSQTDRFTSNFRFNYIIRPGSDLFIVYNEQRDSQATGFLGDPQDRTLVVKLAYLFNL